MLWRFNPIFMQKLNRTFLITSNVNFIEEDQMSIKKYLPSFRTVFKPSHRLFIMVMIGMLFLLPWISTGAEKVSKTKQTVKKKTTTANTLKIIDVSYHIEDGKESFLVTLNRVYKPKVRYIKGANIHSVILFSPVAAFEEKDYSKLIEGSKYVKQIRSYYEKDKKELRFVLGTNGASDYSIAPVSGGSGNVFAIEITEAKAVKREAMDSDDEAPSDL
jgi:hypothetical protein